MDDKTRSIVRRLYSVSKKSIPEVSEATGEPRSTIRFFLKREGLLRSRGDGVRLASDRIGDAIRGKTRVFTDEWRKNISIAKAAAADKTAFGVSLKPSGYVEFTRGKNKGRRVHDVLVENKIGRRLKQNEIVHHKNDIKHDNDEDNLELMTKSEHARLHALANHSKRSRDKGGRFK